MDSKFSITVPEGWTRSEDDQPGFINVTGPAGPDDPRQPVICAAGYPVRGLRADIKTLDDYVRLEREQLNKMGAKLLDVTDTTLAAMPAKRLRADLPQRKTHTISIVALKDGMLHAVTFEGTPEQTKRLSAEIEAIFASYRLTGGR